MRKPEPWMNSSNGPLSLSLVVPELRVADVTYNAEKILAAVRALPATAPAPRIALFPELCLTGCTCGDLFYQPTLAESAFTALEALAGQAWGLEALGVVGLPLQLGSQLFNAAAVFGPAGLLGFSICGTPREPGSQAPSRHFSPGWQLPEFPEVQGHPGLPVGVDLVFHVEGYPPFQVMVGATLGSPPDATVALLLNPCAWPARAESAPGWVQQAETHTAASQTTLALCSCGPTESTTDQVFSGAMGVWQASRWLASTSHPSLLTQTLTLELNLSTTPPAQSVPTTAETVRPSVNAMKLAPNPRPFLPTREKDAFYAKVLEIQALGLATRLRHIRGQSVVVGLSGGADSSMALLACCQAFDLLSLPRENILAVSMPGPGISAASGDRARRLASLAGVTFEVIPIHAALASHLADIHHPAGQFDTTFENAQARERTQILMDLANMRSALVVGTGDLSEAALGWCTYNGDQMSMYAINAGVPKTLLLEVLTWAAGHLLGADGSQLALAITSAPISPELLPPDGTAGLSQTTEGSIGPYLLHDFFLFHAIGQHCLPREVLTRAQAAFRGQFPDAEIAAWLKVFYQRFFTNQFKRSASPDGPQVLSFSLSPRGGWQMPSDASASLWLWELEDRQKEEFNA